MDKNEALKKYKEILFKNPKTDLDIEKMSLLIVDISDIEVAKLAISNEASRFFDEIAVEELRNRNMLFGPLDSREAERILYKIRKKEFDN